MARPTWPADNATGWGTQVRNGWDDISDRADQGITDAAAALAAANSGGGAGDSLAPFGAVSLDSFAGANDDAKLTAALSAVAAETYPRTIQMTNRLYTFTTPNRAPFTGLRIAGPPGTANPERGETKMPSRQELNFDGYWFRNDVTTFTMSFQQLSLTGSSTASFLGGNGNWYCLNLRDIFASGLKSVLGTYAQKMLITAATFDGIWEVNNSYETAYHLGGADSQLWDNGGLLDSAVGFVGSGQPHLWCDYLDKTNIGPMFITGEADWQAIRVSGPAWGTTTDNQGRVSFREMKLEGRNPTQHSYGSLVRVDGGGATFERCWFNYGMGDPSNAAIGRTDQGIIHHTGGELDVAGCWYDRATNVAETVPFVYSTSPGSVYVNRQKRAFRSTGWTGLPRVNLTGTGLKITDASVTVV